jgi:hypothetical protein
VRAAGLTLRGLLRGHDGAPGPPFGGRRGDEAAAGLGAERLRPRRRRQPAEREAAPLRGEDLRESERAGGGEAAGTSKSSLALVGSPRTEGVGGGAYAAA